MITRREVVLGGATLAAAGASGAAIALRAATPPATDIAAAADLARRGRIGYSQPGRATLELLRGQESSPARYAAIGDFAHALHCATRAFRGGESEEYVVCALLHDVGQHLDSRNHDRLAGELLRFHVSERNHWIVANHRIFQASEFSHEPFDLVAAEVWRGHPHFEAALRFCELYDMTSLGAGDESMPPDAFEPMVYRVFAVSP
jgi:predicted HD phosphohydrolase